MSNIAHIGVIGFIDSRYVPTIPAPVDALTSATPNLSHHQASKYAGWYCQTQVGLRVGTIRQQHGTVGLHQMNSLFRSYSLILLASVISSGCISGESPSGIGKDRRTASSRSRLSKGSV
jgi:hypothetical protein